MRAIRTGHAFPAVRNIAYETVVPVDGVRSASAGAPVALRLNVYLTRGRLDRQLAAGHAHDGADELTLRAKHLTNPRTQRDIARNLRGIVRYVDRQESRKGISCVVISPRAVRGGRTAICELAEQLERAAPVNPRGIVLAHKRSSPTATALCSIRTPSGPSPRPRAKSKTRFWKSRRSAITRPRRRLYARYRAVAGETEAENALQSHVP
jgi:hypothetical protein